MSKTLSEQVADLEKELAVLKAKQAAEVVESSKCPVILFCNVAGGASHGYTIDVRGRYIRHWIGGDEVWKDFMARVTETCRIVETKLLPRE